VPESAATGVRIGTPVDGVTVLGALSPSRAADFKACPLLYRFRTIDKLPEAPSAAAVRGTVVHKVLEDLFDLPAAQRTPERAEELIGTAWGLVRSEEPDRTALFAEDEPDAEAAWLASCASSLRGYFTLEDPSRLEPAERELYIETLLDSKLLLRGYVDRIDVAPDGAIRVVDYKTGRSASEAFEAAALFQMRFYALVLWRNRGVIPAMLRLIYLGNTETLSYEPDEQDLLATERLVQALWEAIAEAHATGDWRPNRGSMCGWCSFKAYCPEFGGTPPPLPDAVPGPAAVSVEQQIVEVGDTDPDE
jgi:putative RecB family exonuclease